MMEDNWYGPGPGHCRQMTEEERQYYQEQRRKRHFSWQSKQGHRDLNGHYSRWGETLLWCKGLAAFLSESCRKKPGPPCKTKSGPRVSLQRWQIKRFSFATTAFRFYLR